ncbi:MAG: hypothetical protein WDM85_02095 [Caulobacteraceae bacterium]
MRPVTILILMGVGALATAGLGGCQKAGEAKANVAAAPANTPYIAVPTARPTSTAASSRSPPAPPEWCGLSTSKRAMQ